MQCEGHNDLIQMVKDVKIDVNEKIDKLDTKLTDRMDKIDDDRQKDRDDFLETRGYVKELFRKVDDLVDEVKGLVVTLHHQELESAETKITAEQQKSFIDKVKNLVFEVVKWLVVAMLAYWAGQSGP